MDRASLKLLKYLTFTKPLKDVFVICTYRDNEITHRVSTYIELFDDTEPVDECTTTILHIQQLDVNNINELLSDYLDMEPGDTLSLADVIWRKTGGNAFFVQQYLATLQHRNLLNFSFELHKWVWDIPRIQSELAVSDNVVDLVQARVRNLPDDAQLLLQVVSCLGRQF